MARDSILGLPTTDKFQAFGDRPNSHRRQILHHFPTGGAALTGLLSLLSSESVSDNEYYWYERFFKEQHTRITKVNPGATTASTWSIANGSANDTDVPATPVSPATIQNGAFVWLRVNDIADMKPGLVLGTTKDSTKAGEGRCQFYVIRIGASTTQGDSTGPNKGRREGCILCRVITSSNAITIDNMPDLQPASGAELTALGSAYAEGVLAGAIQSTEFKRPYKVENTTRVFSTKFEFTDQVLKMGLWYDSTGPYREKARQNALDHFVGIEQAVLFGKRTSQLDNLPGSYSLLDRPTGTAQGDLPGASTRMFSGLLEFLELWDAGSDGLTIDGTPYAPYSFKPPSLNDADDGKRIIENASGTINSRQFNIYAERVGRYSNNKSTDRLVLCGSGAILALTEMFKESTVFKVTAEDKLYGLNFTTLRTPFGDYHFTTHPLFNTHPDRRYWALIVDLGSIKLRPFIDCDTTLLKNRQNPGDHRRIDEFYSILGMEVWNPSGHMLIKNLKSYAK
jgi:hypothetical protein